MFVFGVMVGVVGLVLVTRLANRGDVRRLQREWREEDLWRR